MRNYSDGNKKERIIRMSGMLTGKTDGVAEEFVVFVVDFDFGSISRVEVVSLVSDDLLIDLMSEASQDLDFNLADLGQTV